MYEHLVFDEHTPQSVVSYPKLASSAIAVFSFGKTFHVTGWKLGYVLAPENLMQGLGKYISLMFFPVITLSIGCS